MKYYSVERLATLCRVDRETIRRWRNRGVNGIKLESPDTDILRGKPLTFSEEAVRRFIEANPKQLTDALKRDLDGVDNGERVASEGAPNLGDESGYLAQLLRQRRQEILRELEQVENTLRKIGE